MLDQMSFSGSIPKKKPMCAVSDVQPLVTKLLKVMPFCCIISKYGRESLIPHTSSESIAESDSANTTMTFGCLFFPKVFSKNAEGMAQANCQTSLTIVTSL